MLAGEVVAAAAVAAPAGGAWAGAKVGVMGLTGGREGEDAEVRRWRAVVPPPPPRDGTADEDDEAGWEPVSRVRPGMAAAGQVMLETCWLWLLWARSTVMPTRCLLGENG
jgi:hypothetical protein